MDGWRIASPIHNQCHHHHHHGQRNKISIVVKTEDDDLNQTFVCRKRKPTKKGRIGVRFDEVEGDRIDIPPEIQG